jgi:hypothetical protein
MFRIMIFLLLAWATVCSATDGRAADQVRAFTRFSAEMPDGWTGDEPEGFAKPEDDRYMLVFTRRDEEGENIKAAVTVFLLPPLRENTEEIAAKLASMQKNSSSPYQDGLFRAFRGEPQTQFKAPALTRVRSTDRHLLIIIVQDPENLGGERIFASLKALTPDAGEALGR